MNVFCFSGLVTKDPEIRDVNGVSVLRFHISVGTGSGMEPLWVMAEVWKKKLIDRVADEIWQGCLVTCSGTVEGRDRHQAGPIVVRATDVVPHDTPSTTEGT